MPTHQDLGLKQTTPTLRENTHPGTEGKHEMARLLHFQQYQMGLPHSTMDEKGNANRIQPQGPHEQVPNRRPQHLNHTPLNQGLQYSTTHLRNSSLENESPNKRSTNGPKQHHPQGLRTGNENTARGQILRTGHPPTHAIHQTPTTHARTESPHPRQTQQLVERMAAELRNGTDHNTNLR